MSSEPPRRDHYLKQAEQAEAMARRATGAEEKASFEEIARLWRRMAERKPEGDGR